MDPEKLTTSLTELVKKFVISFCEVNVGYNDRLDVFGSIHIRSDDCDVVAFVLNEHCYKKSSADASEDEEDSLRNKKRKSTSIDSEGNRIVKVEQQDAEFFSSQIKSEIHTNSEDARNDVIDIYSDGDGNNEDASVNDINNTENNDIDQNFIDNLLDMQNAQSRRMTNQRRGFSTNFQRKRGRNVASANHRQQRNDLQQEQKQQYQGDIGQNDFGFYQSEDIKPILESQNTDGFADGDVDYGPGVDGHMDFTSKFGIPLSESSGSFKKPRKRNSQSLSSSAAGGSNQGGYFQVESTYTCTVCGCRFRSMDGLKCHVNSKHSQQKVYSCHFCSQTFLTRQASYSHRVKFHNISRSKAGPTAIDIGFS